MALGVALYEAIFHWRDFRSMMEQMGDWMFGTKFLDAKSRGYGAVRAFQVGPHGEPPHPRALPIHQGRIRQWFAAFDKWQDELSDRMHDATVNWLKDNYKDIIKWLGDLYNSFNKWQDALFDQLHEKWVALINTIFNYAQQKWAEFMGWVGADAGMEHVGNGRSTRAKLW